jgi:hypothetical protein
MKRLITLAVAASLVGCASSNNEAAGAAPDRGDTTATATTKVVDPHRTGPPGVQGRPGGATINVDSVTQDTSRVQVDTVAPGGMENAKENRSIPQDTLGPSNLDSLSGGAGYDTTSHDTTSSSTSSYDTTSSPGSTSVDSTSR